MTITPQVRRVLEAIADMSEAVAKSARLLADGEVPEAEEALTGLTCNIPSPAS